MCIRSFAQPEMDAEELEALEEAIRMNKVSAPTYPRLRSACAERSTETDTTCERRVFCDENERWGCSNVD
jgi:hypothetical protein